jgi:hypothetical protein
MPAPVGPLEGLKDHLVLICRAINDAWIQGLSVSPHASPGVVCVSSYGYIRWEADPRMGAVNPLGALVLKQQPRPTEIEAAIRVALGNESPAFSEGVQDGLKAKPANVNILMGPGRRVYHSGYVTGKMVRRVMVERVCLIHRATREHGELCERCAEIERLVLEDDGGAP